MTSVIYFVIVRTTRKPTVGWRPSKNCGSLYTKLNEVMSWRGWTGDTKTEYGKQMQKLHNAWELPEEKDEKVQEDLEKFNELFVKKD